RPAWLEVAPAGVAGGPGPGPVEARSGLRDEALRGPDTGAEPSPGDPDPRPVRSRRTRELVGSIAAAHRATGGPAPRRPWLPPLPRHITVAAIGRPRAAHDGVAVLGLVDEPDLQRVGPLTWHPGGGTWLISGRPGSGRTGALRALVHGSTTLHDPGSLHVHVVDPAACLGDLATLPHTGTHVSGPDHRALLALVDHLRGVVAARRAGGSTQIRSSDAAQPTVLVVVDGWEQLVEALEAAAATGVADDLVRVLRDGSAVGVVGAVSGGRALVQPRWAGLGGSTVLLGRLDPLDVALAGLRAADVPRDPPPGRGIRLQDRREVQFAHVRPSELGPSTGEVRPGSGSAWRHRPLPERITFPRPDRGRGRGAPVTRGDPRVPRSDAGDGHAVGVFGEAHGVWSWRPEVHGRALLVAGPSRSGRTNALHVLMSSMAAAGRTVVLVSRAEPRGGSSPRPADSRATTPDGCGRITVVDPSDVDALVAARRHDPRLAVLVDDADLLDGAPVTAALHEMVELVDRDDGLVVAVSTTSSLAMRFRGLDVAVARRRTGLLLQPDPADLDLWGAPRVRGIPAVPGRGLFVSGGSAAEVQVYLAPP
ncbi:MAG TPA: hypothetical protein VFI44_12150, partial [Ornithinibacter sp.]|nr:hypothetical protein [Ornithinibacter sp.]